MTHTYIAVIFLCVLSSFAASAKLLVFLFDGVRFDYLNSLDLLPGFEEIVEKGVKVRYMTPEFPSLSYPNYYSLMTGRNTETHHMTGNFMWDKDSDKKFLLGRNPDSRLPLWWEGSEPLWVTMENLNKRVYMYNWPGCDVEILGVRPTFCEPYRPYANAANLNDSIRHALDALKDEQAEMAVVYYERVDSVGHNFGPRSVETARAFFEVDDAMLLLNQRVKAKDLTNELNIMMFSDHGMLEITNFIELDKHIDLSDVIKGMDIGAVVSLWPKPEKSQEIYAALNAVEGMETYYRQDIPDRYHYKGGRFVSTMTLVAKPGWIIIPRLSSLPFQPNADDNRKYGTHGYDNEIIEMRGFFVAKGPDFKSNFIAAPIKAVDVYNLMCHTLGIDPLPNNGSFDRVRDMLRESSSIAVSVSQHSWPLILLGILCLHV